MAVFPPLSKVAIAPSAFTFTFSLLKSALLSATNTTKLCIYNGRVVSESPRACVLFAKQRWVSESFHYVILFSSIFENEAMNSIFYINVTGTEF